MIRSSGPRLVVVMLAYCGIAFAFLMFMPWVDWSRQHSIWLLNLACLPTLPNAVSLFRKFKSPC